MAVIDFFKNLPWWIQYPAKAIAAVVGGYVSNNPQIFPSWAVLVGAAVALWVVLAFLWHALNTWREHNQKPRIKLEPSHIIMLGLIIGLGGAVWQMWQPQVVSGASAKPSEGDDTHLGLKFGPLGTTPTATDMANVWRWYALKNVVVIMTADGQRKEVPSWNLFMTFGKPIDAKQVIIEGDALPQYEVKDRDSRSIVVAFMGDILNSSLRVTIDSNVGIKPQPATNTAPAQIQATTQSNPPPPPPSHRKYYSKAAKEELSTAMFKVAQVLGKQGIPAAREGMAISNGADQIDPDQISSLLERGSNVISRLDTIKKEIWGPQGVFANPADPIYDLQQPLESNHSEPNYLLVDFRNKTSKFMEALEAQKLINDRDIKIRVANLARDATQEPMRSAAERFQTWIQQCQVRIEEKQRELGE